MCEINDFINKYKIYYALPIAYECISSVVGTGALITTDYFNGIGRQYIYYTIYYPATDDEDELEYLFKNLDEVRNTFEHIVGEYVSSLISFYVEFV